MGYAVCARPRTLVLNPLTWITERILLSGRHRNGRDSLLRCLCAVLAASFRTPYLDFKAKMPCQKRALSPSSSSLKESGWELSELWCSDPICSAQGPQIQPPRSELMLARIGKGATELGAPAAKKKSYQFRKAPSSRCGSSLVGGVAATGLRSEERGAESLWLQFHRKSHASRARSRLHCVARS